MKGLVTVMIRGHGFSKNEIYHICNKSISNYAIFAKNENVLRFLSLLEYYNDKKNSSRFSYFLKTNKYSYNNLLLQPEQSRVKFLGYCVMKDHYHLLLKVLDEPISSFVGRIENGYSHYFNIKYKRMGPLWQSRFRCIRITTNEQLLHVTRYLHINPCTSRYVSKPEDWPYSSYLSYLDQNLLNSLTEISIKNSQTYRKFCEDQIDYQKTLKDIKDALLE